MLHNYFPSDVIYMRFFQRGKVLRVARVDNGVCCALYPTDNPDFFQQKYFKK